MQNKTLAERAADSLMAWIRRETFRAGDKLPAMIEREKGVSEKGILHAESGSYVLCGKLRDEEMLR